jgi:hypothetical protein
MMHGLITFLLAPSVSLAVVCQPQHPLVTAGRDLVSKVAIIDGIDFVEAAEYARRKNLSTKEIEKRYDGSIVFGCASGSAQGQVVVDRDIIVVSNHLLFKDGDCNKPSDLKKCGVMYQGAGKDEIIRIKKIVHPGGCSSGDKLQNADDWSILQLEKKVPASVTPYALPKLGQELKVGDKLVDVGKSTRFNPRNLPGKLWTHPKGFADCAAVDQDRAFAGLIQTNCPSSPGCSGCGIFKEGDHPVLMGIVLGEMQLNERCRNAGETGTDGPFVKNCRGTIVVPLEGRLLRALMDIKPTK